MTPYLTLFCADIVVVYNRLILLRAIANAKKDMLEHIRPQHDTNSNLKGLAIALVGYKNVLRVMERF